MECVLLKEGEKVLQSSEALQAVVEEVPLTLFYHACKYETYLQTLSL